MNTDFLFRLKVLMVQLQQIEEYLDIETRQEVAGFGGYYPVVRFWVTVDAILMALSRLWCLVFGCDIVDNSSCGPDTFSVSLYCRRCFWSTHTYL